MKKTNFLLTSLLISFIAIGQTVVNVSNTITNANPIPFGLN